VETLQATSQPRGLRGTWLGSRTCSRRAGRYGRYFSSAATESTDAVAAFVAGLRQSLALWILQKYVVSSSTGTLRSSNDENSDWRNSVTPGGRVGRQTRQTNGFMKPVNGCFKLSSAGARILALTTMRTAVPHPTEKHRLLRQVERATGAA